MKMFGVDESIDKIFYYMGLIIIGIGVVGTILCMTVLSDFVAKLPHCLFHTVTGYYCPGCGGKRAVRLLFSGHFLQSLYYHPFVIYSLLVGGWFMISQTIEKVSKKKYTIGMHFRGIYVWIGIGIIFLNCIIKNIALFRWGIKMME